MKLTTPFILASLALSSQASWFSPSETPSTSDSAPLPYTTWTSDELLQWLQAHHVPFTTETEKYTVEDLREAVSSSWSLANAWSYDTYLSFQSSLSNFEQSTFDTWSESELRTWLLERGVVRPATKREELVLQAKGIYANYLDAAEKFKDGAQEKVDDAKTYVAASSETASGELDDAKDYVYSTWDDNKLRSFLVEKGVIKSNEEKKRDEYLKLMKDAYAQTLDTGRAWESWSTAAIQRWLVDHNLLPSTSYPVVSRADLLHKMSLYYYDTRSTVYSTWTDSQLLHWLQTNNIISSSVESVQGGRDQLLSLVENSYGQATTTILSAWSDSHIRTFLVKSGWIDDRSALEKKRDDLISIIQEQLAQGSTAVQATFTSAPYLSWEDNRLRAYLAERSGGGLDVDKRLPKSREGLLQSVRELYGNAKKVVLPPPEPETFTEKLTAAVHEIQDNVWTLFGLQSTPSKPEGWWTSTKRRLNIEL